MWLKCGKTNPTYYLWHAIFRSHVIHICVLSHMNQNQRWSTREMFTFLTYSHHGHKHHGNIGLLMSSLNCAFFVAEWLQQDLTFGTVFWHSPHICIKVKVRTLDFRPNVRLLYLCGFGSLSCCYIQLCPSFDFLSGGVRLC